MHVVIHGEPESRGWMIQRCVDADANHYKDWSPFEVQLMTRSEMLAALKACEQRWPDFEFRGHNVANQRPGADVLRSVR